MTTEPVRRGPVRTRLRSAAAAIALAAAVAAGLPGNPARADVAGRMGEYWSQLGGAANVTGPSAFQGQSAGYYSMGNLFLRNPQRRTQLAAIQLPNYRAGCGGIDFFAGGFSFINADELVALLKATASNALSFAFKLAIDSVSPEIGKVMSELQDLSNRVNAMNIASCEQAALLVGSIWEQGQASEAICTAIGDSQGLFSDRAASRHGCNNAGQRAQTIANGDPDLLDAAPGVSRNFTWHALRKSPRMQGAGGSFNAALAEYVMSIVGTIIVVQPDDGGDGSYRWIGPELNDTLVTVLLDGSTDGSVRMLRCDETDACLNPAWSGTVSITPDQSLRGRLATLVTGMREKVGVTDAPLSAEERGLLNLVSLPLYKILTVQAAYGGAAAVTDDQLVELVAIDLLYAILDDLLAAVTRGGSIPSHSRADAQQFQAHMASVRQLLSAREAQSQQKVQTVLDVIERTAFMEAQLQSRLAPGMVSAFEWSRGIASRNFVR